MNRGVVVDRGKKYLDDLAMAAGNIPKGELLHLAQNRTRLELMVTNVSN